MPYQMENGKWRAHKMIAGERKTKTFPTKTAAKQWEASQNAEEWQSAQEMIPTVCLHEVANMYLEFSLTRHDNRTFQAKRLAFKRLFAVVRPDILPEHLTMRDALASMSKTAGTISNAAANKDRKHLSAFWEFGKKYHGFPRLNPFHETERLPEKPENHYVPPVEDFWKVHAKADEEDKLMLLTLLHTAGRRSEILHLTWEDVDFRQRKIRLATCKTRDGSRKRAWLTLTNELYNALANHKTKAGGMYVFTSKFNGEPYTTRKHFVRRLCLRAGVNPFGYHGIRGLAATILAQTLPIQEVQPILRHSNMTTTVRYIRSLGITSDKLNDVFEAVQPNETASKVRPFKAV